MGTILTHDKLNLIIVDDEDLDKFRNFKWYLIRGYPYRNLTINEITTGRKSRLMALHRFLLTAPKNSVVDHINRNKLDNRKSNLRIVNRRENALNSGNRRNNKTGYKYVQTAPQGRYRIFMRIDGKCYRTKEFFSKESLALIVDDIVLNKKIQFIDLNFPNVPEISKNIKTATLLQLERFVLCSSNGNTQDD